MDKESTKKNPASFRFLKPHEFAALTPHEKSAYIQRVIDAAVSGAPLDESIPPPKKPS